jgi:hypothetical protein
MPPRHGRRYCLSYILRWRGRSLSLDQPVARNEFGGLANCVPRTPSVEAVLLEFASAAPSVTPKEHILDRIRSR